MVLVWRQHHLTATSMAPATMEFASFRAMNDHPRNDSRPRTSVSSPWLPNGKNPSHQRTRGLPSRRELDTVAAEAAQAEAASERSTIAGRLVGAEAAMDGLEQTLDRVGADFQKHMIEATAANILVQTRLREITGVAL